jgi:hypothetical protein
MWMPQQAQADEFCDALTRVVGAASTSFEGIRGLPVRPGWYAGLVELPGAMASNGDPPCVAHHDGVRPSTYGCGFPGTSRTSEIAPLMTTFRARLTSCVGLNATDKSRTTDDAGPFVYETSAARIVTYMAWPPDGGYGAIALVVSPLGPTR